MIPGKTEDYFEEMALAGDGRFAIAYSLLQMTRANESVAFQLRSLGLGDAASPMGAIELLSVSIKEGFEALDGAIRATIDE